MLLAEVIVLLPIIHQCHYFSQRHHFNKLIYLSSLESSQRQKLGSLLKYLADTRWGRKNLKSAWSYEEFSKHLKPSVYSDWQNLIETQKKTADSFICGKVKKYVATSGTTNALKWIPYSRPFQKDLQMAAGAWLTDIGKLYPKTLKGKHYWSLSWIPNHQRNLGMTTDDSSLLSPLSKILHNLIFAVPGASAYLPSCSDSLFASAVYLASSTDLSLMSFWSPSFGLELLNVLEKRKDEIAQILEQGKWTYSLPINKNLQVASLLKNSKGPLCPEFFKQLWPRLALVSSWDSGSSQYWFAKLKALLPHASFQGKGLWATEGVVTIPIGRQKVLAANSHFFEFRDLDTQQIIPAWKVEKGMKLQPLLSTSSGLLRYQLADQIECTGRLRNLPCFNFLGRIGGVDMVGEKLDREVIRKYLQDLRAQGFPVLSLIGVRGSKRPRYDLLVGPSANNTSSLEKETEAFLRNHHHYALARDLAQLDPVKIKLSQDPINSYYKYFSDKPKGQVKIEDLVHSKYRGENV